MTCIKIQNGIICLVKTEFTCPVCGHLHTEKDYYNKLKKKFVIYQGCKGCKTKLGITTDMKGDVQVWLKSKEKTEGKLPKIK